MFNTISHKDNNTSDCCIKRKRKKSPLLIPIKRSEEPSLLQDMCSYRTKWSWSQYFTKNCHDQKSLWTFFAEEVGQNVHWHLFVC